MVTLVWFTALINAAFAQNAVLDWNKIAADTIVTNGGKASVASSVWFAYTQIAVYDAIGAVQHRANRFYYHEDAPKEASAEAAVIAAAHRILSHYFPNQASNLDADYASSLQGLTADPSAIAAGIAVGEASATALIAARSGDGLEADVSYTPGTGTAAWQPTPPKFLPALTPWLAQMRPFTFANASQFLPGGPTPLDSPKWQKDYDQVKTLGSVASTVRTPEQTEIGLFWTEHTGMQYSRSFRRLAEDNHLSLSESARMLAMLWVGFADSGIACWNAKYTYSFWRPVTAIRAGGGNAALTADPDWLPLGTTPNHPEYPAAHGCVTGTVSDLIKEYFQTEHVHIVVDSTVTKTTHTFDEAEDLFQEVFWARIYAGFHYHHSLRDGGELGRTVAEQVVQKFRSGDDGTRAKTPR